MPSRFSFYSTADDIKAKYPVQEMNIKFYEYYNLKPTNRATGIINDENYKVVRLRWGFVKGKQFFKARAESIHEKKLFSKAFRERRCLILVNGFFEWNKDQEISIPYYFSIKEEPLFSIAGVYNSYIDDEDGETKYRFAVITTEANDVVGKVFHRMPAIIPRNRFETWLDPEEIQDNLLQTLQPFDSETMDSWKVDPLPSRGDNGSDTIKPAGTSGLADFF